MSTGTEIELDWTGIESAPGQEVTPPASGVNGAEDERRAYLTDEEILGIEPFGTDATKSNGVIPSVARNPSAIDDAGTAEIRRDSSSPRQSGTPRNDDAHVGVAGQVGLGSMPEWMVAAAGDPKHGAETQQLWQEHQAFRASFSSPEEARAIKELFPGGAQEAQMLRQAAQAVDQVDAAIYSGDARAQSEVVAELARANPAAFRQLFSEAAKVLAGMGQVQAQPGNNQIPTLRENHEGWGSRAAPTGNDPGSEDPGYNNPGRTQSVANESRITSQESPVAGHPSPSLRASQSPATNSSFDPTAYALFERSTNDTVARDVRAAVGDTLGRVLPEGIAEGAARRIGDDIFNEIHRTLAADRSLSEQVGDVLRGRRFGTAEQQQVASLLAGRARQLVPGVARRVIGEWTSSVLGASRSKAARQASAAGRVDIAAPGGSLDSTPLRPMSPREVNYASMSDDEILGM